MMLDCACDYEGKARYIALANGILQRWGYRSCQ